MGKVQDQCNLIRNYRRIDMYPQQMTMQALDMEVFDVMKKIDELQLNAPDMRRQHLKSTADNSGPTGWESYKQYLMNSASRDR